MPITLQRAKDFMLPSGKRLGEATSAEVLVAKKALWQDVEDAAADPLARPGINAPSKIAARQWADFNLALAVMTIWDEK